MELYRVNGDSMHPFLKDGDKVSGIVNIDPLKLKPFDILVFKTNQGSYFCHYFWKFYENFDGGERFIQTRPLNPIWEIDEPVSLSNIRAKVVGKKIGLWLKIKVFIYTFIFKRG